MDTAFQPDAFQGDAFQIWGGPDGAPPVPDTGHPPRRVFRRNPSSPEVIEEDDFFALLE